MPFKIEEQLAALQQKLQCNVQKIKAVQERAASLVEQGYALSSPEVVRQASLCSEYAAAYMTMEKEYRRLVERMEADCCVVSEQTIIEMERLILRIREEIESCGESSLIYPAMGKRTDAQFKLLLMEYLTLQAHCMESRSGCLSLLAQLEKDKISDLFDLDQILPPEKQLMAFSWAISREQERRDQEASRRAYDSDKQ